MLFCYLNTTFRECLSKGARSFIRPTPYKISEPSLVGMKKILASVWLITQMFMAIMDKTLVGVSKQKWQDRKTICCPCLCGEISPRRRNSLSKLKQKACPPSFLLSLVLLLLHTPYEKTVCMIAENCPARFVNDARGVTSASANIQFLQHIDPRDLCHDYSKGLHLFLQGQAVRDIEAGQQLFLDYGNMFWEDHQPIARKVIEEDILNDVGDQPFSLDSEDFRRQTNQCFDNISRS